MNPLRVLGDWISANFDSGGRCAAGGYVPAPLRHSVQEGGCDLRIPSVVLTERERLMRHTGRPECPIPEHADALRQLGRTVMERDQARAEVKDAWERWVAVNRELDGAWRLIHELEAKLRHPCTGQTDTPAA